MQAFGELVSEAATTTLNAAELYAGAMGSNRTEEGMRIVQETLARMPVLPFGPKAAKAYATVRRERRQQGLPGGLMDELIASIAIAEGVPVVTKNVKDFQGCPGLVVESW